MVPSSNTPKLSFNHATLYAKTNASFIFHTIFPLISKEHFTPACFSSDPLMGSHPPKKPPPKHPLCPPPVVIPPRPRPLEHDDEQHHSHVLRAVVIVMACMVGMIMFLCTVSVLMKYFYTRRHNRNQNRRNTHTPILFDVNGDSPTSDNDDDVDDEEELAVVHPIWYIRTVGLQQSLIDSITVFKYKKDDGIIDGTECSVCLGEFEHDESLRLLPKCSHAFHIPCIDTWLRSHKNCPLCRAPVLRDAAQIRAVDQNNINNNQTEVNVSDHQSQNQEGHVEDSDEESGEVRSEDCDVEEETQPMRRAVSVDSFSSSMFRDVVLDLDTHNQNGEKVNSRVKDSNNKGVSVGKNGSESSSSSGNVYKVGSSGRVLQKRTVSMRRSFSNNRKFLFSRHYRSQSSTLPL